MSLLVESEGEITAPSNPNPPRSLDDELRAFTQTFKQQVYSATVYAPPQWQRNRALLPLSVAEFRVKAPSNDVANRRTAMSSRLILNVQSYGFKHERAVLAKLTGDLFTALERSRSNGVLCGVRFLRKAQLLTNVVADFSDARAAESAKRELEYARYDVGFGVVDAGSQGGQQSACSTSLVVMDLGAQQLNGGTGLNAENVTELLSIQPDSMTVVAGFDAGTFLVCFRRAAQVFAILRSPSFSAEFQRYLFRRFSILITGLECDEPTLVFPFGKSNNGRAVEQAAMSTTDAVARDELVVALSEDADDVPMLDAEPNLATDDVTTSSMLPSAVDEFLRSLDPAAATRETASGLLPLPTPRGVAPLDEAVEAWKAAPAPEALLKSMRPRANDISGSSFQTKLQISTCLRNSQFLLHFLRDSTGLSIVIKLLEFSSILDAMVDSMARLLQEDRLFQIVELALKRHPEKCGAIVRSVLDLLTDISSSQIQTRNAIRALSFTDGSQRETIASFLDLRLQDVCRTDRGASVVGVICPRVIGREPMMRLAAGKRPLDPAVLKAMLPLLGVDAAADGIISEAVAEDSSLKTSRVAVEIANRVAGRANAAAHVSSTPSGTGGFRVLPSSGSAAAGTKAPPLPFPALPHGWTWHVSLTRAAFYFKNPSGTSSSYKHPTTQQEYKAAARVVFEHQDRYSVAEFCSAAKLDSAAFRAWLSDNSTNEPFDAAVLAAFATSAADNKKDKDRKRPREGATLGGGDVAPKSADWASEMVDYPPTGYPFPPVNAAELSVGMSKSHGLYYFRDVKTKTASYKHPESKLEYRASPQAFFHDETLQAAAFCTKHRIPETQFMEWLADQRNRDDSIDRAVIRELHLSYKPKK